MMFCNGDDDLFGGLFDFNGDGKTDLDEEFIAYTMFQEMQKEEERERYSRESNTYDLDDFAIDESTTDLDDLDIEGI